ncbi:helix-turn-helix transcriptional regulator [Pedobacter nutrimenti]|jgi:y4mF family transcriptional regulator|uniref:helix-turn-helix transcriptional regulator n=1 Tax=Pedobacter nutrimenti TaxID=1241337 RepID=UPI00292F19BB|nr:helix-turn-helix domain-containing protein [Pedobacter nutrimenti]
MLLSIGESIKFRRKELKITQPHLAELAGVSKNTIYKIERGEANPSLDILTRIADVLGLRLRMDIKQLNDETGNRLL